MASTPGDGGFSNPVIYETDEEMNAAYAAQVEQDAMFRAMSPVERHYYINMINNAEPGELE